MILIDASIAPGVARALGEVRDDVLSGADIYPIGTEDTIWLMEAGVNGWLVITRDKKIVTRAIERQVIRDHAVGVFIIAQKRGPTGPQYRRIILDALEEMEALFETTPRPFVFRIDSELQFRQVLPRTAAPRPHSAP